MSDGRTYTEHVAARVTARQLAAIDRAAKRAGLDRGTWLRIVATVAAGASPLADDLARIERHAVGRGRVSA